MDCDGVAARGEDLLTSLWSEFRLDLLIVSGLPSKLLNEVSICRVEIHDQLKCATLTVTNTTQGALQCRREICSAFLMAVGNAAA